jgi:hypothetical protein
MHDPRRRADVTGVPRCGCDSDDLRQPGLERRKLQRSHGCAWPTPGGTPNWTRPATGCRRKARCPGTPRSCSAARRRLTPDGVTERHGELAVRPGSPVRRVRDQHAAHASGRLALALLLRSAGLPSGPAVQGRSPPRWTSRSRPLSGRALNSSRQPVIFYFSAGLMRVSAAAAGTDRPPISPKIARTTGANPLTGAPLSHKS